MQSEKMNQSLVEHARQFINRAEEFNQLGIKTLTWKENPSSWSILECMEHLNLYGDFYLPAIERKIKQSKTKHEAEFKSGFLGNYFAKSMLPKEKLNKMKTFKDKNPLNAQLDKGVIDKFIQQQIQLLNLLDLSKNVSLNKIKIETSISSLIRMKLGDTFQFYVNHIVRHIAQMDRALAAQEKV